MNLIAKTLPGAGYEGRATTNPREALTLLDAGRTPSLIVADVVMPDLGGRQLADDLVATQPSLKVLYVSGSADEANVQGFPESGVTLLPKPFSPRQLLARVRQVLDEAC